MKYGSVCSGIEAASAAWEPLGWKPVFFSEIDPFPRAVLAHHYPNVPCHGDFTTINRDSYAAIDVLVGGTPCQDFSLAGLRAGLDGGRGNLSLEFGRLLGRLRPQWFCWENVPGVFSSNNGEDFAGILGMFTGRSVSVPADGWRNSGVLQGIGSAYSVAWRVLDAQYLGVPQRRRRVFVVGCLGADWRRAFSVLFESHSMSGDSPPRREKRKESTTRFETSPSADNRDGKQIAFDVSGNPSAVRVSPTLDTRTADGPRRNQGGVCIIPGDWPPEIAPTLDAHYGEKQGLDNQHIDGGAGLFTQIVVKTSDTGSNGSNFNEDGVAYTLDTINGQAVVQPLAFNGQASHHQPMSVEEVSPALDTSKIVNVLQPALSSSSTLGVDDELNASEELMGALKASRHGAFVQFPYTAYGIDEECNAKEELFGSLLRGGEGGTRQTVVQIPELHKIVFDPTVLFYTFEHKGLKHGQKIKGNTTEILQLLQREVGKETVAEWGSRISHSLQQAAVLQQDLHGQVLRRETNCEHTQISKEDAREKDGRKRAMQPLWEGKRKGRSPQGSRCDEQLNRELGEALQKLSHEGSSREEVLHHLWQTPQGSWFLRQALSEIQKIRGSESSENKSALQYFVRRLTVKECSRLQGFQDDFAKIPWKNKPAGECPDGPQYKTYGNSMAVPVMSWIGKRIQMVHEMIMKAQ